MKKTKLINKGKSACVLDVVFASVFRLLLPFRLLLARLVPPRFLIPLWLTCKQHSNNNPQRFFILAKNMANLGGNGLVFKSGAE